MKKVFTAIAISMSAFMATTAMAGPNDHRDDRYQPKPSAHWNKDHRDSRYNDHRKNDGYDNKSRYQSSVNPSRQWRTGQELPRQFSSSRYEVNHNELRRLPKVGRNQQWLKINGDYVLVNERNDRILRIIG